MIERVQAVIARQAAKRDKHGERPLKVAEVVGQTVTREKFVELQKQDQTLRVLWQHAEALGFQESKFGGLLHHKTEYKTHGEKLQLVVPIELRTEVMRLGHESIMSGHQGIRRTYDRIGSTFWWPGLHGDVTQFADHVMLVRCYQRCVAK